MDLSATGGSTLQSVPEGGFLGQVSFDSFNQTAESLVDYRGIKNDAHDTSKNNVSYQPANQISLETPDERLVATLIV